MTCHLTLSESPYCWGWYPWLRTSQKPRAGTFKQGLEPWSTKTTLLLPSGLRIYFFSFPFLPLFPLPLCLQISSRIRRQQTAYASVWVPNTDKPPEHASCVTDRLPAKVHGCSTRAEAPASANPHVRGERQSPVRGCKSPHGQTQPLIGTICFHRGPWGFQYGTLNETGISSWRSAPACCQQPWQPMSSPTRAATTSTGHARFGADYGNQCPYPGVPQVAEAPGRASDHCKALGTRVWGGRAEEACGGLGYGQVGASLFDCKTVRE